jgi:hypothetical protein
MAMRTEAAMARSAMLFALAVAAAGALLTPASSAPARAEAAPPPFAETEPNIESVPQYLRQMAGHDLDDLLLAEGVAAQSGWVNEKYAFYLVSQGPERTPNWLALSLANQADQTPPIRLAAIVGTLLSVADRAAFLRGYDDRLSAAGPWRLCLAHGEQQVLIHNRGSATFLSFAKRPLSADISCADIAAR